MMKRLFAFIGLVPALFISAFVQAGPIESTAWQKVSDGAMLVDVRTQGEYDEGHLEGATLIPFDVAVEKFNEQGIDKDQPIVLYCRSGNRASIAENQLREAGFTDIYNAGGYEKMAASKPVNLSSQACAKNGQAEGC